MTLKPSLTLESLTPIGSLTEGCRLAAAAGFAGLEVPAPLDDDQRNRFENAASTAGLVIHLVRARLTDAHQLASRHPDEVERCVSGTAHAIAAARRWNAAVLVVLGRVPRDMSPDDHFRRAQAVVKTAVMPLAERAGVTVVVENVWCDSLSTADRFASFVDGLESPRAACLFDTGNVFDGHPAEWVPILGHRIARVHAKDLRMDLPARRFAFPALGDGDISWSAVAAALRTSGFSGWVTYADNSRVSPRTWMARQVARVRRLQNRLRGDTSRRADLEAYLRDARRRIAQCLENA